MKKILVLFVLLVAVFWVAVNLSGPLVLGHVLGNTIGAPVSVGRFHLGVFSSTVALYDIEIRNPKGFHEKRLADIHEVSANYDPQDLFRGKVHLKTVKLDFGNLTIEKTARQVNLLELGAVKGITQGIGADGGEAKPGKPDAQKGLALQIDEVSVNIGKTFYVDSSAQPPVVREYDLGIRDETFRNVTNAQSLVKDIAFLVLRKVGLSSLTSNFDILLKGVGGGVQSTLEKLMKK